ncbi:hypothetical protein CHX26_09745 [Porphyrobacter sp. HT-58-2]|uniref:hypothetical protein n=1 Tax=Porphyrobacter sp. HT-58-2 TaxID=2023229 RepID=UPI000CDBB80C|nr:hypothetical protein [Porphyrobacter sp. HT-58-2]AUX69744.1 hypothetical protein CHX26_09745 [Porphyrobacter sp. HT-58-2]
MKFTQTAIAAALALAAATPLSAQDYVADKLVKSVNQGDLLAIVGALGHQVKGQGEAADDIYVAAEDEEGTTYLLFGTACEVNDIPGCQGVMMQVRYDLPATTTFETLAAANFSQAAINIWADFDEKTLGFTRYHVLDHGVTMANIRENINVLLALVAESYPVAAGE